MLIRFLSVFITLCLLSSCSSKRAPLGTEKNPVKVFLIPSVDAQMLKDKAQDLQKGLEELTGYKIKLSVPSSYIAVVEAFGTKRADIAVMNTFGYLLAHRKYDVEAKLIVTRFGDTSYKSQIIARNDSKINSLEDIKGSKFAYVDPASASGYLLAKSLFKKKGIEPSETMFAQKHDSVVSMVYQGQVDAGATFYSPAINGKIQDARRLVKVQFPDVEEKVKIVSLTDPIPNDPIIFRKDIDEEMKTKLLNAFKTYIATEKGKATFEALYLVTGLEDVKDAHYDPVRKLLTELDVNVEKMVK